MVKLPVGASYGFVAARREISGVMFTERSFHSGLTTPSHIHEAFGFYVILSGAFRELQGGKAWVGTPSMVIVTPPDEPHADSWFEPGRTLTADLEASLIEPIHRSCSPLNLSCQFSS